MGIPLLPEKLLQETNNHLIRKTYRHQKYGKHYLSFLTDKAGKETIGPVYNYTILLTLAFNQAHKIYAALRNALKLHETGNIYLERSEINVSDETAQTTQTLSTFEYAALLSQFLSGKNADIKKQLKQLDLHQLLEFSLIEPILFKSLTKLRDYFAHYFHEPGPISFENFFNDSLPYTPNLLSTQDWQGARDWFMQKFDEAKNHKVKQAEQKLQEAENDLIKNQASEALARLLKYHFFLEDKKTITWEALLFISCIFLRKGDAAYIIKKWTGLKKSDGPYKTVHDFFTYYSIRDSKAIQPHNLNLSNFRKIVSQLSSMPYITNVDFIGYYKLIEEHNRESGSTIDELKMQLNEKMTFNQKKGIETKIDRLREKTIPLRKTAVITKWLLTYLHDRGLMEGFEIACHKQIEDRESYINTNNLPDLLSFKNEIKKIKDPALKKEKKKVYHEGKRNFNFKKIEESNNDFCIKHKNALLRLELKGEYVQIIVSPSFLLKWVFVDLEFNKGHGVKDRLIDFVKTTSARLKKTSLEALRNRLDDNYFDLPLRKFLPSSIAKQKDPLEQKQTNRKAKYRLQKRLREIEKFLEVNAAQKKPWQFASKRKIDYVLQYVQYRFLVESYTVGKSVDEIRHDGLNEVEYLNAYDFIRFYGQKRDTPDFQDFFTKRYFKSIAKTFGNCKTLEELFNWTIEEYREQLNRVLSKQTIPNIYERVLKINLSSGDANVEKHQQEIFYKNIEVPHTLISVFQLAGIENKNQFKASFQKSDAGKDFRSEFSYIRHHLENKEGNMAFSNVDYFMKIVMPFKRKQPDQPSKLPAHVYNNLFKVKTEELILWAIAKYYWKEASGENFKINELDQKLSLRDIVPNAGNIKKYIYKERNLYCQIFKKNLVVEINDGDSKFKLSISPKKFDDEYQYYEQSHIVTFLTHYANHDDYLKRMVGKTLDYVEINKRIKHKLAESLDDIYLLLQIEKYFIDKLDMTEKKSKITYLNEQNEIDRFYINFKEAGSLIYNEFGNKMNFTKDQFEEFRNNSLHRQLQNPVCYSKIKTALQELYKNKEIFKLYENDEDTKPRRRYMGERGKILGDRNQ